MVQERALPTFNTNLAEISSEVGLRLYEDMTLGGILRTNAPKCITEVKCLALSIYTTVKRLCLRG